MPKKLVYNSYKLTSGVIQGTDEQVFENLFLKNVVNLKYSKEDALSSIDTYKNLGLDIKAENRDNKYINMMRFRNTLFALTYNEIFRFNEERFDLEVGRYQFDKVGDYLNADVFTHIIQQFNHDIFDPALVVNKSVAYMVYRDSKNVYFEKFNLKSGSRESVIRLSDSGESKFSQFKIDIIGDENERTAIEVTCFKDNQKYSSKPFVDFTFALDEEQEEAESKFSSSPSVVIDGKTFHNLRKWGEFTHENNLFHVVWSENNSYYILNNKGVSIAKIGVSNAPSFDEDYFLNKGNIKVDGDNIYIPLLLSTKESIITRETELQDNQSNLNKKVFFPVGLNIIHFKIDKSNPKVNSFEYANGLILSGPIIQNYDGDRFSEFNFSQRLEDFTIENQESGAFEDFTREAQFKSEEEEEFSVGEGLFASKKRINGIKIGNSPAQTYSFLKTRDNPDEFGASTRQTFLGGDPIYQRSDLEDYLTAENEFQNDEFEIVTIGTNVVTPVNLGFDGTSSDIETGRDREDQSETFDGDEFAFNKIYVVKDDQGRIVNFFFWDRTRYDDDGARPRDRDDDDEGETTYTFKAFFDDENHDSGFFFQSSVVAKIRDSAIGTRFTVEVYNLSDTAEFRGEGDEDTDLRSLEAFFDFTEVNSRDNVTLRKNEESSNYSLSTTIQEEFVYFRITNTSPEDTEINEPPKVDVFNRAVIQEGNNTFSYNLNGGGAVHTLDGHSRTIKVPIGDLVLDKTKQYKVIVYDTIDALWVVDEDITYNDSNQNEFIIEKIEIDEDTFGAKVFFNRPASELSNNLRFQILGVSNYIFTSRTDKDNVATFNREGLPITELSGLAKDDADLVFRFQEIGEGDFDFLLLRKNTYQYAGYYKWIDRTGKEHVSRLSDQKPITIFGEIGRSYTQVGVDEPKKIELNLKFKNLDLTTKLGVSFVLLRAKIAGGTRVSDTYKIVKEVDVTPNESEFITIKDDIRDQDTYGVILGSIYSQIIQPPGAKSVAIGRRNRIFLGNVIGFENSVFFSNSLSSESVDIFSFSTDPSKSGVLYFDNKILGLDNLDTNLLVFTSRGIFYLPAENLNPQFIHESENNYASQSGGIVSWSKGVTYISDKGIQSVDRGFNTKWISKNVLDETESSGFKITNVKSSHKDREIRFYEESGRVLVYNTEYDKWTFEDYLKGAEQEIEGKRFKFDQSNNLHITTKEALSNQVEHYIETGWINYTSSAKGTLLRDIYIIGDFGNCTDFNVQLLYNYDETNFPELYKDLKPLQNNKIVKISSRQQKISSLKLKITIVSDRVKLSSIGFQVRKQTGGAKLGGSQTF